MTTQQIVFLIFSLITLGAGLAVVTKRNVFHAALFLILSFFGVAGLYVLLEAPFLAGVQFFIYIGAIAILIIFAVMLTRGLMARLGPRANTQWWLGAVVAVGLFVLLAWVALSYNWPATDAPVPETSIADLGRALVHPEGYILPFEVASVVLLVALIGAVTIVRER